jgi:UDP-N-acetylglucosamine 2-epimerase (non-hydrolysing)
MHLGVGSGGHTEQTAKVMLSYGEACAINRPDLIIVIGDVNSTMACALVGAKACIKVAHLEAGLRSNDRSMPEEINRLITDTIADILWTPSSDADANLLHEGVSADKITRVGNIMIDSYEMLRNRIEMNRTRHELGLNGEEYCVVTLHRPSNVDDPDILEKCVNQLINVARIIPLVFPVHPRTRKNLEKSALWQRLTQAPGVQIVAPMGYVDFMNLVSGARLIITDSGGVQEETTYLGIPCLTLRDTTERPITLTQGTNRLVNPEGLLQAFDNVCNGHFQRGRKPELWDGAAAARVVVDIRQRFNVAQRIAALNGKTHISSQPIAAL